MNRIACVVFLFLLILPAGLAQVRESLTVEVVEVPVYITSSDGKPIRGLARGAEIVEEDELRARFGGEPLLNVNTPEELESAMRYA